MIDTQAIKLEVWNASKAMNETNDCTVKAITIATGLPYRQVHAAFAAHGRKHRRGVPRLITMAACRELGYEMHEVPQTAYKGRTGVTIERDKRLQNGRYVIGMTRHLAGMVDGTLVDWSAGRRKRVNGVFTVRQIKAPKPAKPATVFKPFRAVPVQIKLI